jgi:hypothetical protein
MTYVEELAHELGPVGIRGRLRRRIVAEIADHLASNPLAELGPPQALARQFANELGTIRSRLAAFAAFASLAVAGIAYAVAFFAASAADIHPRLLHARTPALAGLAAAVTVLAPQVAFVAGTLGALRAFRRRRDAVLPAVEARVLKRRVSLALLSGLAATVAVGLLAYEYAAELPPWLRTLGYVCATVGTGAVLVALMVALAAGGARVTAPGDPGDVFADLGPLVPARLRGRPWAFALAVAATVCAAITVAGIAQSDPFDGAARGLADGAAVLAGFALLGRYLGLRSR